MDRRVLWRGALLLVLLTAFALRISGVMVQSLWRDEVDALRFSQAPLTTLAANFTRTGWNGPLYYVFLRLWVAFAGSSELALRYFSLCFGVIGVALTWRLGRAWFSPFAGGLAALLMATSPYMVWYGQEAKMYTLVCALVLATLILYHRALTRGDWRAWVAVLALTWTVVVVHIMGALLVPVMVVLFFVWWPVSRVQWRQALLVLAGIAAPAIAVLPWVLPALIRGGDIGHRFVGLPEMVSMMFHAFSRGIMAGSEVWPMGVALVALLAGSVFWPVRRDGGVSALAEGAPAYALALWAWMFVPVLGLYLISLRMPMFVDRYLIWIGPAFYVLVGRGMDQIRRRAMPVAAIGLTAMLVFNAWGLWQQNATPIKSDFRSAAAYVWEHRQPDELVLFHISYVRYAFEYYYGDAAPFADGIPTNGQTTESSVDALMRQRTDGYEVVWLVLSEPEMWDQRGMTVAWLDAHAEADMRTDLTRVSVIRYRIVRDRP